VGSRRAGLSVGAPPTRAPTRRRTRVRVRGTVQGVGFRPYVYRLAGEHGLGGFVLNDTAGVLLEVEGRPAAVERFLDRLPREAPPLAVIEGLSCEEREPQLERAFAIAESPGGGVADAPVAPDCAVCGDCLRELFDPADRRFRYPFINCTNCGPRFTIVRGIPYDRPQTTMAGFPMCGDCLAEYEDPANRRFHAQPNACPRCGPSLRLLRPDGASLAVADPVRAAAEALADGAIVAVKGIGGVHLACDAASERAVSELRSRKHREDRPFALMVASLEAARSLAQIGPAEHELLTGVERPIVLVARRPRAPGAPVAVATSVAPAVPELGIMLPYSPLHHLLLHDFALLADGRGALVMTSGNVSDEPIAYRDDEALARLAAIADLLLLHERPIETRTDDSVVRVVRTPGAPHRVLLRRSRGYVPVSLPLPRGAPGPILACGGELKNTFCVARGERAWVGHHIGDLENYETLRSFEDGIEHFKRLFELEPEIVAHDLHPEYLSTKYAQELDGVQLVGVQHHHAHLAACLAEHGHRGAAVGAIFDGTGFGTDGTVWGGELLVADLDGFRRVGMLLPVPLPGGASAIREPWRMACAWLRASGAAEGVPRALRAAVPGRRWREVAELAGSGLCPSTSSMGRLFDAVAALCGLRPRVTYEGQAAIELEAACDPGERGSYPLPVGQALGTTVLDPRETILAIAADARRRIPVGTIASRFHAAVADATVRACSLAAAAGGTDAVVLCGGVFQNRRLLEATAAGLVDAGARVLIPELLPIGDGGISFGQAAVAATRLARRGGAGE
jgi:hydrogenase maturation protein HypF